MIPMLALSLVLTTVAPSPPTSSESYRALVDIMPKVLIASRGI